MSRLTLAVIPVVALFVVSCKTAPDLNVSTYWIPAMSVIADQDVHEDDRDIRMDADVESGMGWAARVGLQTEEDRYEGVEFGLLYMTTRHAESSADTHMTTHSAYLEIFFPLAPDAEPPFFFGGLGLGIGGVVLNFDSEFPASGGVAGMLRAEAGIRPLEDFSIVASVGGSIWGYPSEATGHGAFLMLGAALDF